MTSRWGRSTLALFLSVELGLAWLHTPRPALADSSLGGATCTYANLKAALAAGGAVTFNADCTILFAQGFNNSPIEVANTATIDGAGHVVIFDGAAISQLFTVDNGANLTLRGLTLRNGQATPEGGANACGGAIDNRGTLTIQKSTLSQNYATAAILSTGAGFGGAISNSGKLTIQQSALDDNHVMGGVGGANGFGGGFGGAIFSAGAGSVLVISHSTLNGNSASGYIFGGVSPSILGMFDGYGGFGGGFGGAVYNGVGGRGTVVNSTLDDNQAIGGGIVSSAGGGGNNGKDIGLGAPSCLYGIGLGGPAGSGGAPGGNGALGGGGGAPGGKGGFGAGDGSASASSGPGGGSGLGGGLFNDGATLTVVHSVVSGNTAAGAQGGAGASSGSGLGGGIYNYSDGTNAARLILVNNVIADNSQTAPSTDVAGDNVPASPRGTAR